MRLLSAVCAILCVSALVYAQETPKSSGPIATDAGPRWFYKQSTGPKHQPNRGVLYTKVKPETGIVTLYYKDDQGNETELAGGGVAPGSVKWCGATAGTYDGDDAGTYSAANALCQTVGTCTNGHVCSVNEVLALISKGDTFTGASGLMWSNAGGPGYTAYATDCGGWSETSHTNPSAYTYGHIWDFSGSQPIPFLGFCTSSYRYMCCE